jgi:flagellar biosynthesis/type III secretory pathway chaperone
VEKKLQAILDEKRALLAELEDEKRGIILRGIESEMAESQKKFETLLAEVEALVKDTKSS